MSLKNYGVLKGIPTHYRNSKEANNHYQIKIDATGDFFRIAVNVRSKTIPRDLQYKLVDGFSHPGLASLGELNFGFTELERKPNQGGLDYIRGNLFDIETMLVIPDSQEGIHNDLNDIFDFYVHKAIKEKGIFYAFGERWFPKEAGAKDKYFKDIPDQGIHDIHMNQGNPNPGDFSKDNGVWQDGGVLMYFPSSNNWVALFLKFQTQVIHTDDITGHPLSDSIVIEPTLTSGIKIMAALVNPSGSDEGSEKVILFNPTPNTVDMNNWAIANQTKKNINFSLMIKSGETVTIKLSKDVPLSNKGGIITLLNKDGVKIDGVNYTKEQAGIEGSWVVF